MSVKIEIRGLNELQRRFRQFPDVFKREVRRTLQASLLTLQENVPSYPPAPIGSSYVRTGQLGRSLGNTMSGARIGSADIMKIDNTRLEATFGTNLHYAPDVIGDSTQKAIFQRIGWYTMKDIRKRAERKIYQLFDEMAEDLARWLDRGA